MELLSTELLLIIFMKLPCKDVLICKCVCKEWYDLLSNPNFTTNYARNSPFSSLLFVQPRSASSFLLEFDADGGVILTHLCPKIPNFQLIPKFQPIPNFQQVSHNSESKDTVIIGSCNGFLFFKQSRRIPNCNRVVDKVYCCNPLFRGFVEIVVEEVAGVLWSMRYIIGYISSTDNIKLLRISTKGGKDGEEVKQSDILTVGIDRTWRRVDDGSLDWYADRFYHKVRGVCFNGAYHWIILHKWLCTFDFGEEKTGPKLMLPELLQQPRQEMDLVVLNNHISLIDIDIDNNFAIQVWTMREYGIAKSWALSRTIMLEDSVVLEDSPLPVPVCPLLLAVFDNGDILFIDSRGHKIIYVTNRGGIKIHDFPSSTILYEAAFAPRFYPLDRVWEGQMLYPLDQTWDVQNTQSLDTEKKLWSNMLCFFRTAWRKYGCI